jgi:CheY-like chemotaxis protein
MNLRPGLCRRARPARNPRIAQKYQVVLMDVQMPVMDGLEAIRVIREWEPSHSPNRTRIVALTASALADDVRRTRQAGADLHLTKPIRKAMLLAVLNASLASPPPFHRSPRSPDFRRRHASENQQTLRLLRPIRSLNGQGGGQVARV